MAAVSETIVREYFELLGYLVSQPRKYISMGRNRSPEEEADLVVINPSVTDQKLPGHIVWTTPDLKNVGQAVVGVRGWHTERFYAATFEQTPEILRFAEGDAMEVITRRLGSGTVARILCLPRLPASGELKQETIKVLREKGIDGIISFETILLELVARVDKNKNYEKSDVLQMIRILKSYDLLKDSQMDLFVKGRKPREAKRKSETAQPETETPA